MIDWSRLWVTEWIVLGFFAYLILPARVFPLSSRQRLQLLVVGLVCAGLAVMLSQLRLSPILRVAREWLPAIYLLQGYWLSGLFFRRPMLAVEQRLIDVDRTLFRLANLTAFSNARTEAVARVPRVDAPVGLSPGPDQLRPVQLAGLPHFRRQLLDSRPDRRVRMLRLSPVDPNAPTPEPRAPEPVDRSKPLLPSAEHPRARPEQRAGQHLPQRPCIRSSWPQRSP